MKKVIFLLLAVLMISTIFVGCDNPSQSPSTPNLTEKFVPEVNPEYSGTANPPQGEMLRIVLVTRQNTNFTEVTEIDAVQELELDITYYVEAIVKNHKNEIIDVDKSKFKFEVINKKDSVFTFPNDETGANPEVYPTDNAFSITGKKQASGVLLKVSHPKVFYLKQQMFNIKKIDHIWDSEYQGTQESLNAQNEGYTSEKVIFKFKDNKYELYEKQFIKRKYKGKDIKILVKDGSVRGYFEIKGSKLILDNKYSFEIVRSTTSIKLVQDFKNIDDTTTAWSFIYQINKTKGNPIFN